MIRRDARELLGELLGELPGKLRFETHLAAFWIAWEFGEPCR